jgi:MFS family permease
VAGRFCALFLARAFTPLINGPTLAVLTARPPPDLRARVMTAAISVNTLAAPLGFLIAGQVLERWGVVPLFTGVVLGITWIAIVFAGDHGASLRRGEPFEPATS